MKGRKHGFGSSIDVELAVDAGAALSTGEIRLRYAVELAGFDRVPARVFDFPRVDGMAFQPPAPVTKTRATLLVPGSDYVLVLSGKALLDLRPRSPFTGGDRFTNVTVLDASDTTLRIGLRPVRIGSARIATTDFKIEKLRCVESPSGSASVEISVAVPPTPAPTPTPRPATPTLNRPAAGLKLLPTPIPTPTPNRACLDQKARETAKLSADAARCGDTAACVQIRKNEQKAIEERFQACLAKGAK